MASEQGLPTVAEMFDGATGELRKAYTALGDAADWLRSDWRPLGSSLTRAQAAAKRRVYEEIVFAKAAINAAHDAIESTRPAPSTEDGGSR